MKIKSKKLQIDVWHRLEMARYLRSFLNTINWILRDFLTKKKYMYKYKSKKD